MRAGRINRVAQSGTIAAMSPNPRVMTGAGTNPYVPYITKDGKHAYVSQFGNGTIAMFSRDSTGALTALSPTATVNCAYGPYVIAEWTDANGSFIYATSGGGDVVRLFSRNTTTGVLALVASYSTAVTPIGIAISSDGKFVYVACKNPGGLSAVSQFSRNLTNGQLAPLTPASVTFGPSDAEAHGIVMVGTNIYVGTFVGSLIYAFTQNATTGLLNAATTASYTAGSEPAWLAASPDGKHLYAANDASATISQFAINADGTLSPLSPASLPTGGGPFSVVVTPDGKNVYTGDSDGQTISMFSRDTTTGILTAKTIPRLRSDIFVATASGSGGPQSICVSPDNQNLYACGTLAGHSVSQFHIKP